MDCPHRSLGRPPRGPAPLHPERTVCRNGSARPERIPQLLHRPLPSQRNRKATEGTSFRDRRFAQNWEAAGRLRAQRGAYHFFRSSADPEKQAANFIATVGPLRHGDLSPVLDIETLHRGCTKDTLNQRALTWLKAVEKHYGRRPVIYTSDRFALDILSSDITEHYPLWIARYGGKTPDSPACTMWQFTDRAVIHGIRGYVDLSVVTAP